MERRKFYFFYKGKKHQKLTGVHIDFNPNSMDFRTVYFMYAYYKGDTCTSVIVYEKDSSDHGGRYIEIMYKDFIRRIWTVQSAPTPPSFIGLKEIKPPLYMIPGIVTGFTFFAIAIAFVILCKGSVFWCFGIAIIFVTWLIKTARKSIYYTRR